MTADAAVTQRIRIRAYRPEDHKTVIELFLAGMHSYITPDLEHLFDDAMAESLNGDLASIQETYFDKGGFFWLATIEEDEKEVLVGMVALERKADNEGELRRMSVKAEYRRYGVGRLLVSHLENWAKKEGMTKVWLGTGGIMQQAQKFYQSMGYKHFKTEKFMEEPPLEAYFYEKEIA
ncbi:hypothetical protein Poli38472_009974 [Pythium oligandrum]|uniref:N-acetyltransferase domain-containing protein n=1 Tax=Pythium oligandrum TaxID=41045 RepID=A0A8K1C8V2_PYTOL|nr:hypothetical protein Poli38472_009974 [Pythium oligandrum]|eukprot:TMW58415.1 hypothetical protein Poli38472_009974 [Pythium oligandrum]